MFATSNGRILFFGIALVVLIAILVTVESSPADEGGMERISEIRCDSCGQECAGMCGSRMFRACCFNYLKKKRSSGPAAVLSPSSVLRNYGKLLSKHDLQHDLKKNEYTQDNNEEPILLYGEFFPFGNNL